MISFVGMQTQEVTIKPHVKVILKSDSELLEEVVVTGYGTFKKASFTGAASTVNTSTLEDVPVLSVADKLSGTKAKGSFAYRSRNSIYRTTVQRISIKEELSASISRRCSP